jgi:hypothetical protein
MTRSTSRRIEEEANRYGINFVRGDEAHNYKPAWQVKCGYCPEIKQFYGWPPDTSPELMVKNVRHHEWFVGLGDKPACQTCAHPKREKKPTLHLTLVEKPKNAAQTAAEDLFRPIPKTSEEPNMTDTISAASQIVATPSPKIMRSLHEGLSAYFDEKSRLYGGGYSDAKLAKEVGTTEAVVARTRREAYGELAEDPMVGEIRSQVDALDVRLSEQAKGNALVMREMRSRIEQLVARLGK